MTNHYDVLGITETATAQDIKKAYKKLASKYHPDKNSSPNASSQFNRVKMAYDVLSDSDKRSRYNSTLRPETDLESIFGKYRKKHSYADSKPTYTVKISLKQAYTGTVVKITNDSVTIPKGVRNGNKLFLTKYIIVIQLVPHKKFKRDKDDLLVDVNINAIEAMTGIDVILETIDCRKLKFKITDGIQPGQIIKLKGNGMPNPETDSYGDLLIRVNISIPRLTNTEKDSIIHLLNRKTIEQ